MKSPKRPGLLLEDLYAAVEADYRLKKRRDRNLKGRWRNHLRPFFSTKAASEVTPETVSLYITKRLEAGAAPATVNRELAILRHAFKLAVKTGRLRFDQQPYISLLPEDNVRGGFLRTGQYEALGRETQAEGLWLRALFEVAVTYGWRKGELLNLRVNQVDLAEGTISLEGRQTKNRKARVVPMTAKVAELLTQCLTGKSPTDYVFTRPPIGRGCLFKYKGRGHNSRFWWCQYRSDGKLMRESTHTEDETEAREILRAKTAGVDPGPGQRIWRFSKTWAEVCRRAGVPGLLFHDLRRTAARNLRRRGVPENIAMKITGHLTPSMFRRYDIIDGADIKKAVERLNPTPALLPSQAGAPLFHCVPLSSGTERCAESGCGREASFAVQLRGGQLTPYCAGHVHVKWALALAALPEPEK